VPVGHSVAAPQCAGGFMHERAQPGAPPGVLQAVVPTGQTPPSGGGLQVGAGPPQVQGCTQSWPAAHVTAPH
jgi:hypothetical protein